VVQRGSPLVSRLQLPQGVPALLVALQGSLLGKAHITQFGGHDIWEEEVWFCAKACVHNNVLVLLEQVQCLYQQPMMVRGCGVLFG
jgi:hypothetical protein